MVAKQSHREALERLWGSRDLREVTSAALKPLIGTPGEWDPPEGVEPEREPLRLSVGLPDSATLPIVELKAGMDEAFARKDDAAFRYGFGEGYMKIRQYLVDRYNGERGGEVAPDQFQLTNGSSGAIDLVTRSIIDPGDVIVVEEPTYMGTLRNFRGLRADIAGVAVDADGMDVAQLETTVRRLKRAGKRVKMVYTISAFQNPSGFTLTHARREHLLRLAAREDFIVLDDVAYEELNYDDSMPPALSAMAGGHGVITVGSFSKILATGLRIGWVHAAPELIRAFARMRFSMGQNQLALRMMGNFLQAGHLQPHAERVRALYRAKMETVTAALQRYGSEYMSFEKPTGGFYLWVELREGLSAEAVWRAAMREGVTVNPGYAFYPGRREPGPEHMRLAYSWTPPEDLEEAARRLSRACERVASGDRI